MLIWILAVTATVIVLVVDPAAAEPLQIAEHHLTSPQWITSSRLLKLGEKIDFHFFVPAGTQTEDLTIFPRYLEGAHPGEEFTADGDLAWLEALESETVRLRFTHGQATVSYQPQAPGNYLARWRAGGELFYRYFSVIEDDWVVVRFSTGGRLHPRPGFHATGIPLDYRLAVERKSEGFSAYVGDCGEFDPDDPVFQKFLDYHRHYGDAIIPFLADTPDMSPAERAEYYGALLDKVRRLLPDPGNARLARVSMRHPLDPGYTETFMRLGVNNHCGLEEANCAPWLGMPEFPYFSSPVDCRKVNQGRGGSVVAHQWDFCGGWHFLGPLNWHYKQADGQWEKTEQCLRQGVAEGQNLAELSGHPAFLLPLHEVYPHAIVQQGEKVYAKAEVPYARTDPLFKYAERFQRLIAFTLTKEYQLVFARSIDLADYYRRHFPVTPRTVFVSKTDHFNYDRHWLCGGGVATPETIPWNTDMSEIMNARSQGKPTPYKDPMAYEYILVEDQHRQMRFERECPNPIWYFDYTEQERGPEGSAITYVVTPDVRVTRPRWRQSDEGLTTRLIMRTEATFPNYAIALWGLPAEFAPDSWRIETDAQEYILARNTDGEHHLVLLFDLEPNAVLRVTLRKP